MRLIDADKIRYKLKQKEINPATRFINEVLIGLLDDAPTVDAIPVVRCKECNNAPKCYGDVIMRSRGGGNIYCPLEFCSQAGRRKTDGSN